MSGDGEMPCRAGRGGCRRWARAPLPVTCSGCPARYHHHVGEATARSWRVFRDQHVLARAREYQRHLVVAPAEAAVHLQGCRRRIAPGRRCARRRPARPSARRPVPARSRAPASSACEVLQPAWPPIAGCARCRRGAGRGRACRWFTTISGENSSSAVRLVGAAAAGRRAAQEVVPAGGVRDHRKSSPRPACSVACSWRGSKSASSFEVAIADHVAARARRRLRTRRDPRSGWRCHASWCPPRAVRRRSRRCR